MRRGERAATALSLRMPDEVPTFELEFQLADVMFGKPFVPPELESERIGLLGPRERERLIQEAAEWKCEVYDRLEYAILPVYGPGFHEAYRAGRIEPGSDYDIFLKRVIATNKGEALLGCHGDGTFSIPDGNRMYDFAYQIADDPDGVKRRAQEMADFACARNARFADAGIDVFLLCSDYCYNSGPFLSPAMFAQFVTPYLHQVVDGVRGLGRFAIKHTDGNIMPVLDQLVSCNPHALHSIDPMAGVDIREVKRLVGHKVALCGNVHCAAMQTGTDEEVRASAEYCLTHAKPGGGYLFCTSNVPFKGMPPERYSMILDIWKRMRKYEEYDPTAARSHG